MNAGIKDSDHPSIIYYDSDYPSREYATYPENFDSQVIHQGIADDVELYKSLMRQYGKNVLEVCCGTGRIAIPLVQDGCHLTAVDLNEALLKQFKNKIQAIPGFRTEQLTIVKQDITRLSLTKKDFDVVICAFNSLLCIPDFDLQQQALIKIADHIKPNGLLALDIWNPLNMNITGDDLPAPFFTRRNPFNGNRYTRFAGTGPMDIRQVQRVYGWYEETLRDGSIERKSYELQWRPIFRYEIQLMLEKAGFSLRRISGDNNNNPLTQHSLKMFIEAVRG
jgi:SAM-dependent methyltransferase